MIHFLYSYLVSPLRFLEDARSRSLALESMVVILVMSLVFSLFLGAHALSILGLTLGIALVILATLFFQSLIIDFFAQVLGFQASSLVVFQRLTIACLPSIFWVPAVSFSVGWPLAKPWILGCSQLILLWIAFLQIHGIRSTYDSSNGKGILLFFSPLALLGAIATSIVLLFLLAIFNLLN